MCTNYKPVTDEDRLLAHFGVSRPDEEAPPETYINVRANLETNLIGMLSVVQATLPTLRAQRSGRILTVSSIGGVLSFPTGGGYVASKFALEAMSETPAGEVSPYGIRVTIVEPRSYATGFRLATTIAPPLRLLLGDGALSMIEKAYEARLELWRKWRSVSIAGQ